MQAKLNDYARGFSSFTLDCIIVIWSHWSTAHAYLDKTRHAYLSPIKISASKTVFDHFNPKAGCLPEQIKRQIHDKQLLYVDITEFTQFIFLSTFLTLGPLLCGFEANRSGLN